MVWVASRSLTWQMLVLFFEKKDTSSETGDYCVLFLLWENQVMLWLWVCSNTWDSMIPWDGLNLYEETDSEKITHFDMSWLPCEASPVSRFAPGTKRVTFFSPKQPPLSFDCKRTIHDWPDLCCMCGCVCLRILWGHPNQCLHVGSFMKGIDSNAACFQMAIFAGAKHTKASQFPMPRCSHVSFVIGKWYPWAAFGCVAEGYQRCPFLGFWDSEGRFGVDQALAACLQGRLLGETCNARRVFEVYPPWWWYIDHDDHHDDDDHDQEDQWDHDSMPTWEFCPSQSRCLSPVVVLCNERTLKSLRCMDLMTGESNKAFTCAVT